MSDNSKNKMKTLQEKLWKHNTTGRLVKPTLTQLKAAQTPAARKAAIKSILNKLPDWKWNAHSEYAQNVMIIREIDLMNYLASRDPASVTKLATAINNFIN